MNQADIKDYMYHPALGWLSPAAARRLLDNLGKDDKKKDKKEKKAKPDSGKEKERILAVKPPTLPACTFPTLSPRLKKEEPAVNLIAAPMVSKAMTVKPPKIPQRTIVRLPDGTQFDSGLTMYFPDEPKK